MRHLAKILVFAVFSLPCRCWPKGLRTSRPDSRPWRRLPNRAQSAGDNAWMLVSAALVLMMTGPGLALFYGGLVRRKNVLGTMMQSFILMAVVTVSVGRGRLQPGLRRRHRRSSAICTTRS